MREPFIPLKFYGKIMTIYIADCWFYKSKIISYELFLRGSLVSVVKPTVFEYHKVYLT